MIRWCSYCQAYAGEVEPFDDYRMTHTICVRCSDAGAWEDDERLDHARELRDFYDRLRQAARSGTLGAGEALLDEATERGIRAVDLAVGMLQPMMREVGELWSRGEVTVAIEHRVSLTVEAVFGHVYAAHPDIRSAARHDGPDVLLVPAPGNAHLLGLALMELMLLERGASCLAMAQGDTLDGLVAEVERRRPRLLGVSLALPEHLAGADALAARVAALGLEPAPTVVYGGLAVRLGLASRVPDRPWVHDADEVIARLGAARA